MWLQIALFVVSIVISYAMQPKPPNPKPPTLEEMNVPTTEEGRELPWVFGEWLFKDPNCVWFGDLKTRPIRKGGK